MHAVDVMTTNVISVGPDTGIPEVAHLLLKNRISAVPVIDGDGQLRGMVSEGDLMRRPESGTERHPSWWLSLAAAPKDRARDYIKTHGGHAKDVMTAPVTTIAENASLADIAETLERHRIKRVPVVRNGKVVGIVSRANLLHGLVAGKAGTAPSLDDRAMRETLLQEIGETGVQGHFISVVVAGGRVHLWGAVESETEKRALHVAAESLPGVKGIQDEVHVLPTIAMATLWV